MGVTLSNFVSADLHVFQREYINMYISLLLGFFWQKDFVIHRINNK